MFRKICLIFLAFLLLLAFPTKSFAVTVSITNYPSSISADPFSISVSILGASSGTNYIRVDLYKDGTQNYFGDTYNGSDWYNGSDGKQYYPITIVDSKSTASATLQTRTGVPSVSDYDGQGSYKMRIRRYTSSGGSGSEDPNNTSVAISIKSQLLLPLSPMLFQFLIKHPLLIKHQRLRVGQRLFWVKAIEVLEFTLFYQGECYWLQAYIS